MTEITTAEPSETVLQADGLEGTVTKPLEKAPARKAKAVSDALKAMHAGEAASDEPAKPAPETADTKDPEPAKKAEAKAKEPEPLTLTPRQRQAVSDLKYSDEELAALHETIGTEKLTAMLDTFAQRHDRVMAKIGAEKQAADAAIAKAKALQDAPAPDAKEADDTEDVPDTKTQTKKQAEPTKALTPKDLVDPEDEYMVSAERVADRLNVMDRQVRELEARIAAGDSRVETIQIALTTSDAEQFWLTLDSSAHPHFGKGPSDQLDPKGPQYQARQELKAEAETYRAGMKAQGQQPVGIFHAMQRMLGITETPTRTAKPRAGAPDNRALPPEQTSEEAKNAVIRAKMQAAGIRLDPR